MAKATCVFSTPPTGTSLITRRGALGAIAAAAAAGSIAGIAQAIAAAFPADPIFAAIAAHQETVRTLDATLAERQLIYKPGDLDAPELDPGIVDAERRAAGVVVNTAPTTRAGLKALEAHLANDKSSLCWWWIRNQLVDEGQTFDYPCSGMEYFSIPVARFVARRAAAIAAEGR